MRSKKAWIRRQNKWHCPDIRRKTERVQDSASELCKSQGQMPSVKRLLQTGNLKFLREEESRTEQA